MRIDCFIETQGRRSFPRANMLSDLSNFACQQTPIFNLVGGVTNLSFQQKSTSTTCRASVVLELVLESIFLRIWSSASTDALSLWTTLDPTSRRWSAGGYICGGTLSLRLVYCLDFGWMGLLLRKVSIAPWSTSSSDVCLRSLSWEMLVIYEAKQKE